MPKARPLFLHRTVTRHGSIAWYFHRKGEKRIRITGTFGTPEFNAQYQAALSGTLLEAPSTKSRLTIAWAVEQFMASSKWAGLAGESRKQMGYQFTRIVDNAGTRMLPAVTRKHILDGQDRRRAVPSDANKYVRAMTMLFAYAVDQEWIGASPVYNIPTLKTSKTGEGFRTWDENDHANFKQRWPIGTQERLAYEIFHCTGLRRSDAYRLGRQHLKDGSFTIRTQKTGVTVVGTVFPALRAAIDATETGDLSFLLSSLKRPFTTSASFGNWFGRACREAGVFASAHGIRKAVAAEAAEGGATEAQLNSQFGWMHGSRESATYVAKASRAKMAAQVGNILTRTRSKGKSQK